MAQGKIQADSISATHRVSEVTTSERKQTDESLRAERETADQALERDLTDIDEAADAVVSRARARGAIGGSR